jgi:hypothetical protein
LAPLVLERVFGCLIFLGPDNWYTGNLIGLLCGAHLHKLLGKPRVVEMCK